MRTINKSGMTGINYYNDSLAPDLRFTEDGW